MAGIWAMARTQNRLRESDDRSGKEMIAAARIACRKMITRKKFRKENKRDETLGRTLHERNESAGSQF